MNYDGIIIYYNDSLYNRESRYCVFGDIKFDNGCAKFKSMGHSYSLPMSQITRIVDGKGE